MKALAETMLPRHDGVGLGASDIELVEYMDDILRNVPLRERFLVRGMFFMFEYQMLFTQPRSGARFSKASAADREKNLRAWDKSDLYVRRLAFQALRSLFLWGYVDNPEVARALGVEPGTEVTRKRREIASKRSRRKQPGMPHTVAAPDPLLVAAGLAGAALQES